MRALFVIAPDSPTANQARDFTANTLSRASGRACFLVLRDVEIDTDKHPLSFHVDVLELQLIERHQKVRAGA
jgi:hypothetical protein